MQKKPRIRQGRWNCLAALSGLLCLLSGCGPSELSAVSVKSAPARFIDVSEEAGLHYAWTIEGQRPLNILQTIGNGCAFLDYDGDGNLDILLVGARLALYKGDGKGRFQDVTRVVGLDKLTGHFLGCAVGDYDNDGCPDLYISGYRTGLLLHNDGGQRFRDVTAQSGIKPQPWGTSCAFAETEPGSRRLDLYICNYAVFGPHEEQLCNENGILTSCGPRHYQPIRGVLYRNLGGGHFIEATGTSGLDKASGRALGVAFADFDGSGRPGLALANDEMQGDLFQPTGKGQTRYLNIGELSATAYDRDGNVHGGMGMDWGDYDNDGRLDLFVATFQNETKSLYHNDGDGRFSDMGAPTGLNATAAPNVAFGCKLFDYDNDGWLDLIIANGHVQDNIAQINRAAAYRQSLQLFHNGGQLPVAFTDVSAAAGPDFARKIVGRGLAVGDYDNDGRLDVLVVDAEGKPLLLHNQGQDTGHWLGVKLIGVRCNREGYGAMLTLTARGKSLLRPCQSCGSYLSASDPRVHFGLGSAARVETLTVRWPDGHTDTYHDLAADQYITVQEGKPAR